MDSAVRHPVLRRKVDAARDDQFARAMSMRKALRLTVPKVADDLFGLSLGVIGVTQKQVSQAQTLPLFSDETLLVLLDGPHGTVAVVALDADLVGAIIQQQTMVNVTRPVAEPRIMTRTDAAMVAPLLDAVLQRSAALLETDAERQVFDGFKFGARVEDVRTLGLMLEAQDYWMFSLSADISGGVRQAEMLFCLPIPVTRQHQIADTADHPDAQPTLNPLIMSASAELTAVLCKLRLPLSEVQAFGVGDVIPVARAALGETGLHAQTGRRICRAQLGQSGGYRALKLVGDDRARRAAQFQGETDSDPTAQDANNSADLDLSDPQILAEDASAVPPVPDGPAKSEIDTAATIVGDFSGADSGMVQT